MSDVALAAEHERVVALALALKRVVLESGEAAIVALAREALEGTGWR